MRKPQPSLLKSFWQKSQTKFYAYCQLAGSGALASVSTINHAVSDPNIKSYLDQIDLPKSLIIALAVFGILSFVFHGHDD